MLSLVLKEKERNLNSVTFWTRFLPREARQSSLSRCSDEETSFTKIEENDIRNNAQDIMEAKLEEYHSDDIDNTDNAIGIVPKIQGQNGGIFFKMFQYMCLGRRFSHLSKMKDYVTEANHPLHEENPWKTILNILTVLIILTTVFVYVYFR